jgi:hypothetical protein
MTKPGTKQTLTKQLQQALGRLGATEARRKESIIQLAGLDAELGETRRREHALLDIAILAVETIEDDSLRRATCHMIADGLRSRLAKLHVERQRWGQQGVGASSGVASSGQHDKGPL